MRVFRLGWFWISVPIWLEKVHKHNIKSIHLWQNQDRLNFPPLGNQATLLQPSFITEEQNTPGHSGHLTSLRNKCVGHQVAPCHAILWWDPDCQLWKTPARQPTSHAPRRKKACLKSCAVPLAVSFSCMPDKQGMKGSRSSFHSFPA